MRPRLLYLLRIYNTSNNLRHNFHVDDVAAVAAVVAVDLPVCVVAFPDLLVVFLPGLPVVFLPDLLVAFPGLPVVFLLGLLVLSYSLPPSIRSIYFFIFFS